MRKLAYSLFIGCALGLAPFAILNLASDSGLVHLLKIGSYVLLVSGVLIALLYSTGHLRDINFTVAEIANGAFYSVLAYLLSDGFARLRAKRQRRMDANAVSKDASDIPPA